MPLDPQFFRLPGNEASVYYCTGYFPMQESRNVFCQQMYLYVD